MKRALRYGSSHIIELEATRMLKDTDDFNDTLAAMSADKLCFIIRALIAAKHVDQYTVEKAIEMADTMKVA
jgi:hypothetical protein